MAGAISLLDYANQTTNRLRAGLVQAITNESVFLRILRFIPIPTFTYRYGEQTTLGGVAFRAINEDYSADTGVVNPKVESLAVFGGKVLTDRQLVRADGNNDPRANSIAAKLKKAGLFYDKNVIDGDPGTDPKAFYGLNPRLTGNQVITAGANGAALTLDMLDQALDRVAGTNDRKLIVCNKFHARKLKQLVVASAGGAAVMDVGKGIKEYDGAKIEVIDEDGDEAPILGFDETQGSSSITSSLYVIRPGQDTEGEFVQGLVKHGGVGDMIDHVELAQVGTQLVDLVEAAMGLAVFHGRSAVRVKGILAL